MTYAEAASRAGMSSQNLYRIRMGEIEISYRAADGIEDALQWSRGSVQRLLDGKSPVEIEMPAGDVLPADDEIDQEMYSYLTLVKGAIDTSGAPVDLKNKLIQAEFALWRDRVPDGPKFLRTWLRWVSDLKGGAPGTERDDPHQIG